MVSAKAAKNQLIWFLTRRWLRGCTWPCIESQTWSPSSSSSSSPSPPFPPEALNKKSKRIILSPYSSHIGLIFSVQVDYQSRMTISIRPKNTKKYNLIYQYMKSCETSQIKWDHLESKNNLSSDDMRNIVEDKLKISIYFIEQFLNENFKFSLV